MNAYHNSLARFLNHTAHNSRFCPANETHHFLIDLLESGKHFRNTLIAMTIINVLISITAFGLNLLIILTLLKTASLWIPSNVLLLGLAFSDLGVATITEPSYCSYLVSILNVNLKWIDKSRSVFLTWYWVFFSASLLTVTAITIDRFLAIKLHLRYQSIVTCKREAFVVTFICIGSTIWRFLPINKIIWNFVTEILIFLLIFANVCVMFMISKVVHKHRSEIHAMQVQSVQFNITRYRRTVNTMYYIIGLFVLCLLPRWIFTAAGYFGKVGKLGSFLDANTAKALLAIDFLTVTLVNISSVFNPILYCWRIQGMRTAAIQLLQKIWTALKTCFSAEDRNP